MITRPLARGLILSLFVVAAAPNRHSATSATPAAKKDALFQNLIRMSTTAFWDAYLKDDANARKWLADGGFAAALNGNGTFEKR